MKFGKPTTRVEIASADDTLDIIAHNAEAAGKESTQRFLRNLGVPEVEVSASLREAIAANAGADSVIEAHQPPDTRAPLADDMSDSDTADRLTGASKLSRLVDDDFPFDESQLAAIHGMVGEKYACMTGAAGTGKTTSTKKFVDLLLESSSLTEVNMQDYWKRGSSAADADDEYEAPEDWIPAVAMVSFTGRATQMIKKNFPRDWHGNIMTIHRLLGFYPEPFEDWDEESQEYVTKRRFVPTYTADLLLPWDVIIIDEAGMLGLDLWHQLYAALKPDCRIYMIGDINQLPPVHGKPIFGFALAKWPAWELTHVHRQQGANNAIVDNAWRILHGRRPESEGRFQMLELKKTDGSSADVAYASRLVRGMMPKLQGKGIYDPIRDTIITPINGLEDSRGRELGQLPLNQQFALMFNPQSEHPRYQIDGGRELKQFAVGDKVMATKNDWEAGITNGMTGIITEIAEHAGYSGDKRRFGRLEDVAEYMRSEGVDETIGFTLEELNDSFEAVDQGMKDKKEKRERGPASHIITVRFGDNLELPFSTLSEVGSLMTAYVVTCHKMQGGEAPTIVIICHDSHKSMLYREWLYTAVTRASEKCILLYTETALRTALNKQSIKGSTLAEKIQSFLALVDPKGLMAGGALKVLLPESENKGNRIADSKALAPVQERHMVTQAERTGGLASLLAKKARRLEGETIPAPEAPVVERTIHVHHIIRETQTIVVEIDRGQRTETNAERVAPVETIDGGELSASGSVDGPVRVVGVDGTREPLALPAPAVPLSQWGAVHMLQRIERDRETPLLTYQPNQTMLYQMRMLQGPVVEKPIPPKSTELAKALARLNAVKVENIGGSRKSEEPATVSPAPAKKSLWGRKS